MSLVIRQALLVDCRYTLSEVLCGRVVAPDILECISATYTGTPRLQILKSTKAHNYIPGKKSSC